MLKTIVIKWPLKVGKLVKNDLPQTCDEICVKVECVAFKLESIFNKSLIVLLIFLVTGSYIIMMVLTIVSILYYVSITTQSLVKLCTY